MPPRFHRYGKPFSSVPALALSILFSLACFSPSFARAPSASSLPETGTKPAVKRVLAPGTARPSARSIAQRATPPKQPVKVAAAPKQAPGMPKHIAIPNAGIDARVIGLGLLPGGKLDAPKKGEDTGWYQGSVKPGMQGTSVIDGHLNTAEGPGAFWNLSKVKTGDTVQVTDDKGVTRSFRVTKTAVYDVNAAPMTDIFTSKSGTHLNLITCAGEWSLKLNHYDKRLIVYSELIPSGAVALK